MQQEADKRALYRKRTFDDGVSAESCVYEAHHVDDQPRAAMLVSVPKRYFKHAVDRNRVKRQVREAFRRNKSIITQNLTDDHEAVAMAFVWLTDEKFPSSEVENRMVRLLTRISECL